MAFDAGGPPNPLERALHVVYRLGYRALLTWWRVRRPSLLGAFVAVWHDGRVLMIRNSYKQTLGLPGGSVGRGEDLREAARRELREEVGIPTHAASLEYVGEFLELSRWADDHVHIFELRCREAPEIRPDGREVVWAGFMHPADAIDRGTSVTARTYLRYRSAQRSRSVRS